jgi:hypothetical protein
MWPSIENREQIKEQFLKYLCDGMTVHRAAAMMGSISRKTLYVWRNEDSVEGEDFKAAWDEAVECGTEELEQVLADYGKGDLVKVRVEDPETGEITYEKRYVGGDTKSLMFILRARNRKRFGTTAVDLRADGGVINVQLNKDDLDL